MNMAPRNRTHKPDQTPEAALHAAVFLIGADKDAGLRCLRNSMKDVSCIGAVLGIRFRRGELFGEVWLA